MTSRPLGLLCAAALALGAVGAAGCGDSSDSEDQRTSAASTNGSPSSTTKDAKSGDATSKPAKPAKPGITFGQQSASGEAAVAQAQGIIDKPEIIRLRVIAQPPQNVNVSYTLLCTKKGKTGGDTRQFSASTPIDREVEIPNGKPTKCNVSANAQLEFGKRGKVTMKLRGRER